MPVKIKYDEETNQYTFELGVTAMEWLKIAQEKIEVYVGEEYTSDVSDEARENYEKFVGLLKEQLENSVAVYTVLERTRQQYEATVNATKIKNPEFQDSEVKLHFPEQTMPNLGKKNKNI